MDRVLTSTGLINQATTERTCGPQNAPSTASALTTPYDGIAVTYDASTWWPDTLAELAAVSKLAPGLSDADVLDAGAGTGRLLDSGLVSLEKTTAVDPSGPMLNESVRKYPEVRAVQPTSVLEYLQRHPDARYDFVTAIGGTGSYLDLATLVELARRARHTLVVSHYTGERAPRGLARHLLPDYAKASREFATNLARERGGDVVEAGGVRLVLIPISARPS